MQNKKPSNYAKLNFSIINGFQFEEEHILLGNVQNKKLSNCAKLKFIIINVFEFEEEHILPGNMQNKKLSNYWYRLCSV